MAAIHRSIGYRRLNTTYPDPTRHNLTYNCWNRLQPGSSRLQPVAGAKNAYITRLQPAPASENAYITRLQQLAGAGLEPAGAGWSRLEPAGAGWSQLEPAGASWNRLEPAGASGWSRVKVVFILSSKK